jgi:hypothetical protein
MKIFWEIAWNLWELFLFFLDKLVANLGIRYPMESGGRWYDLNMYIINVIADDETKIGLYEIIFLND